MNDAMLSIAKNIRDARKPAVVSEETLKEKAACIGVALGREDHRGGLEEALLHAKQLAALYGQAVETDNPYNLVRMPALRCIRKEIADHCLNENITDGQIDDVLDAVDRWAGREMTSRFPALHEVSRPGVGLDVGVLACRELLSARERLLGRADGHAAATIVPRRGRTSLIGRIETAVHNHRRANIERQAGKFRTDELPRGIAADALCRAVSTHLHFLAPDEPLGMDLHIARDRMALEKARRYCDGSRASRRRFERAYELMGDAQREAKRPSGPASDAELAM